MIGCVARVRKLCDQLTNGSFYRRMISVERVGMDKEIHITDVGIGIFQEYQGRITCAVELLAESKSIFKASLSAKPNQDTTPSPVLQTKTQLRPLSCVPLQEAQERFCRYKQEVIPIPNPFYAGGFCPYGNRKNQFFSAFFSCKLGNNLIQY